jgi:hypothetical protein
MNPFSESETNDRWLTSDEARQVLKVSSCELMHLRDAGKLPFRKKGNAFLYDPAAVARLAGRKTSEGTH